MKPHVLILEDNFFLAENLAEIVQQDLFGQPVTVSTVAEALKCIPDDIALAFLDVELLDGKSYPAARKLMLNKIPFIFVSGNEQASLPWPARYFVPDAVRDYCIGSFPSRGVGFGAMVGGAGGL